jgi:perosamine synthetase
MNDKATPLESAKYGAKAFDPSTDKLPGVFPREMGPNAIKYLTEVVESGLASNLYDRFTDYLSNLYGVRYAVGTPGCTQAIFAAMLGMDFEPGSEIIVSPIADYGTIAGMLFEGYIPVFADTDPGTVLISASTIAPRIGERTKAIMCVHKLGIPCDMNPIMDLAREHGLIVLTDVCQSILAEYDGSLTATLGDLGCFSFDAEKTCGGDIGGAVLTDNEELYKRIENRALARGAYAVPGFGRTHTYQGFATRMPQCTAATCLANLEILAPQVANRRAMAKRLDDQIAMIPGITPYAVPAGRTHTYWMYGFSIDPSSLRCSVDEFAAELKDAGIPGVGTGKYYLMPGALPFLTEKAESGIYPFSLVPDDYRHTYCAEATPNAKQFLDTWVRWSWTEKYTADHIDYIAGLIREVVGKVGA